MHIRFIFCTLENIYKYLQTHLRLCEICGFYKKRKPSGSRHGDTFEYPTKCSTDEASNSIKNAIKMKGDQRLQALVGDINLHVKEVKYHNNCQKSYIQSVGSCDNVDTYEKQECTSMTSLRDSHQIAFVSLSNYIEDNIIKGMQEESLPSLHKRYMETLVENSGYSTSYSTKSLKSKLEDHFKDNIIFDMSSKKKGNILKSARYKDASNMEAVQTAKQIIKEILDL